MNAAEVCAAVTRVIERGNVSRVVVSHNVGSEPVRVVEVWEDDGDLHITIEPINPQAQDSEE